VTTLLRRTAYITIPHAFADAMWLFTPEGERLWAGAEGWDPHYPLADRTDGVGAVFTTEHAGRETVWVIVDRTDTKIRYARATPGFTAGTVEVEVAADVAPAQPEMSFTVSYELTALSDAGAHSLAAFDQQYDEDIASWERDIRAALESRGGHPPT
jgi:hypothetical protein